MSNLNRATNDQLQTTITIKETFQCAIVDEAGNEIPITEQMIQDATSYLDCPE